MPYYRRFGPPWRVGCALRAPLKTRVYQNAEDFDRRPRFSPQRVRELVQNLLLSGHEDFHLLRLGEFRHLGSGH